MYADDIIYGGLGDDFLHGGSGDDAISGAEALAEVKVIVYPDDGTTNDVRTDGIEVLTGYDRPFVQSDLEEQLDYKVRVLAYEALKLEEFASYDEHFPRERIIINGYEFLLRVSLRAPARRPA